MYESNMNTKITTILKYLTFFTYDSAFVVKLIISILYRSTKSVLILETAAKKLFLNAHLFIHAASMLGGGKRSN